MQTTLEPKRLCSADDALWLTYRQGGIGASEAAAAVGISDWQTPLELYYRKLGQLSPVEENRAMRLGRKLEPVIADEFEAETRLHIAQRSPGLFCHPEAEHILATPDGIIDADTLLEIKTMNDRRAQEALGEQYTDEIPFEWNVQAQQQMFVMGARSVWFAVLVGGADFRIYEIQRSEKAIDGIVRKVNDLWQRIVGGNPPEMTAEHRSNLQLAKELFGKVKTGNLITLSEESANGWEEYEALGRVIKESEKERDEIKARVLFELGENEAGKLPDGRWVRRKVISKSEHVVKASTYVDVRAVLAKTY